MSRIDDESAGGRTRPRRSLPHRFLAFALLSTVVTAGAPAPAAADDSPRIAVAPLTAIDRSDSTPWTLPETPRRCTRLEAESGDVGHCLIAFYDDPADTGWGAPPAPGLGEGWNWLGYTYNGSPALAEWEATRIAANAERIGSLPAGHLETHIAAQTLFEGFLAEITAGGYRVFDAHGYSFRCTSGHGGWSCPTGNPRDLSNHAWGLAIDMNAATNPIRGYSSIDGQTACRTPMVTDMPRWVIRVAETWGLYWGGYGWNSGCQTLDTQRSTVYRDPPHFEFRGTPQHARAIAAYHLRNDPDARCTDVVSDAGETAERCTLTARPEAGWRLRVDTDAPDDAVAALVNLTATEPEAAGFLTLEHCGPVRPHRSTSAVNFGAGETAAAMAIVPLDDGAFCVYRSTAVHSIVDVVGFLTTSGDERRWFEPTTPIRLTDTRIDGACRGDDCFDGPVSSRSLTQVRTGDEAPRIVNLTVTGGEGPGHASAGRCDVVEGAEFSNINYVADAARANLALVDNGEPGSCVSVYTATHVIVDQLGRLISDETQGGLGWRVDAPQRMLDTRECADDWCAGMPAAGEVIEVDLGTDAAGVAVTITVDQPDGPGHAWIGNCDDLVDGEPETSNVNYAPGSATANLAIAAPTDGIVCVYTYAPAHVIVDLQAELVDDHTVGLLPVTPHRAHDSRT